MPDSEKTKEAQAEAQVDAKADSQPDNSAILSAAIGAASRAEARAALAEDASRRAIAAAKQANQPKREDPLDRLAAEDVTLQPDQRKALLGAAIEGRARAIAGQAVEHMRRESAQREQALESKIVLESVMSARPELSQPEAASDFAAAMTKAKFEMDAAGVQYSSSQLTQRAAGIYDKQFRKVEKPPVLEGAGNPNIGGLPQGAQLQTGPSHLEKTYGMKTGQIQELFDPNDPVAISKMVNEYVNAKNKPMFERGAVTGMQEIIKAGEVA